LQFVARPGSTLCRDAPPGYTVPCRVQCAQEVHHACVDPPTHPHRPRIPRTRLRTLLLRCAQEEQNY